ncbi:helix-turn-helix domain-containing protein [Ohtaekwangia kribbensis]|jgi:AraC family transcriptional activator of pobA|uniref:Helix-turn-helix domain-containing protein n=1 Tax=Ohtaekwangia kribbensis TaxID=688913 RepID=A0ABW3K4A3_9BACT
MKLKNYNGLYKEHVACTSPFYIYSESIRDRSALFNWKVEPHLHTNLYQIFLIESTSVKVDTTSGVHELSAPAAIFIPPGIVHGFEFDTHVTGRIITIADTFVDSILKSASNIQVKLKNLSVITEFQQVSDFRELVTLAFAVHNEVADEQIGKDFAVKTLVSLLLVKLFRLISASYCNEASVSLFEDYYRDFQNSVKKSGPFTKSVAQYASELNITTVHLNRICQAVAGKPASWLIQEHAVREAQKLLRYTSQSVSEIAYQLNFSAPEYFARLFKKHTGMTPVSFRKQ